MASTLDIHDNVPDDKNQELESMVESDGDVNDEMKQFEDEDIYFENNENEQYCMDKPALYSVKLLETWCRQNGEKIDLKMDSPQTINRILSCFYPDVRNKTGEPYSHSTLALFRYGLNRFFQNELVREGGTKIDIIEDPEFRQANNIFKHVIKVMKEHNPVHEAQIITPEHIRRIYASYAFSLLDAKCLLYKIWFEITVFFGKPKHDQQRSLRKDDFVIGTDENGCRFVTKKGLAPGDGQSFPRMYEKKGDPQCPVLSFEKYLSKLDKGYIYLFQRPRDKTPVNPQQAWYMPMSPGKNFMFRMMSRISKLANLDTIFTNSVLKKLHRGLLIDMFLHRHDMIQLSVAKVIGHAPPDMKVNNLFDNSDKHTSSDSKEVDSSTVLGSYRPILPADAKESITSKKNVSGSLHKKLQLVRMYPHKQNEEITAVMDPVGSKPGIAPSGSVQSVQLHGIKISLHQHSAGECRGDTPLTYEKEPSPKFGVEEAKVRVKMIFQELDYPDLVQLDCWLKKVEVLKDTSGNVICRDPTPDVNNHFTQGGDLILNANPSPKAKTTQNDDVSKADQTLIGEMMPKGEPQKTDQTPNHDATRKPALMPRCETQKSNTVPKKGVTRKSDFVPKADVTLKCNIMPKCDVTKKCDQVPVSGASPKSVEKRKNDQTSKADVTSSGVKPKDDRTLTKTYGKKRQELVVLYPNIISRNRKRPGNKTQTTTRPTKTLNAQPIPSVAFSPSAELPMNPAPVIGTIVPVTALSSGTGQSEKSSEVPIKPTSKKQPSNIQVKIEPGFTTTVATTTSTTVAFTTTLATTATTQSASASNDTVTVPSTVEMVLPPSNPVWHIPQIQSHQVQDIKPERDILSLSVLNPSTLIMHSIPRIPLNITDSTLAQRLVQFPPHGSYYLRTNSSVDMTGSIGSVVPDTGKAAKASDVSTKSSAVPVVSVVSSAAVLVSDKSPSVSVASVAPLAVPVATVESSSIFVASLSSSSSPPVVSPGAVAVATVESSCPRAVSPGAVCIPEPEQLNESLANARGASMKYTASDKLYTSDEEKTSTAVPNSPETRELKKRPASGKNGLGSFKRKKLNIINMLAKKKLNVTVVNHTE